MSCQIKDFAKLIDLDDIRTRLFNNVANKFDHVTDNELPLQNCFVSFSPAGDILAIASNNRLVILASKWDSQEINEIKNKFSILWDGDVAFEQNERVTSVITLPLISHGVTNAGVDWTCVAIGFNTGKIKFYTETGGLLLEEQLHNENIINIKCQSHCTARHSGDAGTSEEVYVLYNTVICVLQGFTLFSTLRAFRNHLARVKANCNDKPPLANLVCKKWNFKNQDSINDCEVIGSTSVNTFDHLTTASICGGFNASYRSSAPQHNLVMAIGKRPFIGFHYALEGGSTPVLSDVAIAMASKVASAIGAAVPWFKNTKNLSTPEKTILSEPPETMTCRFGISDVLREGDNILVSPNKFLSVVCDVMGRVILIDNKQGIAIRMWKGYRDAQCSWIESTLKDHCGKSSSSSNSKKKRRALFLAIYAPRKGIIDIWSVQNGGKISTFSANKNGRLLYINYGLCGLNDSAITSSNRAHYPCVFIDPLGGIKEINVPFHFALSSQNSNKARDMHLYKKLKNLLKNQDFDNEKLTNIFKDFKTNEARFQTIEMLITNKNITPDLLLSAIKYFSESETLEKANDLEPETKALNLILSQLKSVTRFYNYLRSQYDQPPEYNTVAADTLPDDKTLSLALFTSEREIQRILKLSKTLENLKNTKQTKVTFKDEGKSFLDFLSCFRFGKSGFLGLQSEINLDKLCQISKLIFQGWMYSNDPISKWREYALNSDIKPSVLMQFALHYWLTRKTGAPLEIELINFIKILNAVCSLTDTEEIYASYNKVSIWWKKVQDVLLNSEYPFNALTAAMVCRAVSVSIQRNKDRSLAGCYKDCDDNKNDFEEKLKKTNRDDKSSSEEEIMNNIGDWENVSRDACQFSLLIGNLEDISILDAIVSQNLSKLDDSMKFFALPFEPISISLGLVISKGKGFVTEIVAKWLSSTGIDPRELVDKSDIEFDQLQISTDRSVNEVKATESTRDILPVVPDEIGVEVKTDLTVLDKVSLLKRHFSYSLTSSVLLANLSWEFVIYWNKNITRLESLEAALITLRCIPSKRVRHGVCNLLWTLHLKKIMENTGKLINKSGRVPKKRLCMQDVGLSDDQLIIFLQHCVTFLDLFLETEVLEEENCSFIKSEELWEGHSNGPLPFALLAVTQSPASYDLILLHYQLASILHMMANFNLKFQKPLSNLFDSSINQYFFKDISTNVDIPWFQDERRDSCRVEFLCQVITASMEFIHQETTEVNSFSTAQAVNWMSKCCNLALTWKISSDELRIHQVCQMYLNGFDSLAEEISMAVNDAEKLAENLLPIAGGRMMAYLSKSPHMLEEISRISPTLLSYLQCLSLNSQNIVYTNCPDEDTIELIQKISRDIPESHHQYHIAQLMLDATFIYKGDEPIGK